MSISTSLCCMFGLLAVMGTTASADILSEARSVPIALDTYSVIVADLNGDGRDDVVTTIPARRLIGVLVARADGTFANMPALNAAGDIATGDFDGDGNIDLVNVDNSSSESSKVVVYRGGGDGTFHQTWSTFLGERTGLFALADLNADGKLDLVLGNTSRLMTMLGLPDGTFLPPVVSPYAVYGIFVDVTGDNILDLVGQVFDGHHWTPAFFVGNGDGTIGPPQELTEGVELIAQARGDFNGDGIKDAVTIYNRGDHELGEQTGVLAVHLGNGDGTFQPLVETLVDPVWQTFSTDKDFDGDGRDDLVYVTIGGTFEQYPGHTNLIFGTNAGTPDHIETYFNVGIQNVLVGDFNGDGFVDLASASNGPNYDTFSLTLRLNTRFAFRSATFLVKPDKPLRVALNGANFTADARVFIGDSATPWSQVKFKSPERLILKGGDELERAFPVGVAVAVRVENSDGRSGTISVTR